MACCRHRRCPTSTRSDLRGAFSLRTVLNQNSTMELLNAALRARWMATAFTLIVLSGCALSITRYSIPEEMEEGSFVANLATDLGLDVRTLTQREAKLNFANSKNYLDIKKDTGELVIREKIDRESICTSKNTSCFLKMDVILESPIRIFNIELEIMDINDNAPMFPQPFYTIYVKENNSPGVLLSSISAHDPDLNENQRLFYSIMEKKIGKTSVSMPLSMNSENGDLHALRTFDYERERDFLFHIKARDSGVPPLSSNITVHMIIQDQNDNAPIIVSPQGSVVEEVIPRSAEEGHLVAKVIAIDVDSEQNSGVTYHFLDMITTDASLFSLDKDNGEIRTTRTLTYRDPRQHRLVIVAKDNGDPALSATVTIKVLMEETRLGTISEKIESTTPTARSVAPNFGPWVLTIFAGPPTLVNFLFFFLIPFIL